MSRRTLCAQARIEQARKGRLLNNRPHPPTELAGKVCAIANRDNLEAGLAPHDPRGGHHSGICGLRTTWREKQHRAPTVAFYAALRCVQDDLVMLGKNSLDRLKLLAVLVLLRQRCAGNFDIPSIID